MWSQATARKHLGLPDGPLSQRQIRQACLRLARRHHPDLGGDPDLFRKAKDAEAWLLGTLRVDEVSLDGHDDEIRVGTRFVVAYLAVDGVEMAVTPEFSARLEELDGEIVIGVYLPVVGVATPLMSAGRLVVTLLLGDEVAGTMDRPICGRTYDKGGSLSAMWFLPVD